MSTSSEDSNVESHVVYSAYITVRGKRIYRANGKPFRFVVKTKK